MEKLKYLLKIVLECSNRVQCMYSILLIHTFINVKNLYIKLRVIFLSQHPKCCTQTPRQAGLKLTMSLIKQMSTPEMCKRQIRGSNIYLDRRKGRSMKSPNLLTIEEFTQNSRAGLGINLRQVRNKRVRNAGKQLYKQATRNWS